MSGSEQQDRFEKELWALITKYYDEYDMTLADAIGTIEVVKLGLYHQNLNSGDDE